jgi:archaellum biogenesis ATPase FlaH
MSGAPLEFGASNQSQRIRRLVDIPDIRTMQIPPVEYIVPALGIARNTITLWTGPDGEGKTFLAQVMALAVSRGDTFLGMTCTESSVLYLDLENPGHMVQDRLRALMEDDEKTPIGLRFWGTWRELDQEPPHVDSELLLNICKEDKPLLIIDPFRYFHGAEENDSTEMAGVMQYLRACAAHGAAVVILHHPSKAEGSTGRGSSVIRGACDVALLHSLNKEAGQITVKVDKNRHGSSRTITVSADFEEGKFDLADAPYVTRRNDELDELERIITDEPGLSQNAIWKLAGGRRDRIYKLLKEGVGNRWSSESGKHGSILYSPLCKPLSPKAGIGDTGKKKPTNDNLYHCPPPLGGDRIQVGVGTKELPSCQHCQSYAIHRRNDGTSMCQTCEHEVSNQ